MELVEYSDQNVQRLPPISNKSNGTRYTLATSAIPHQLPAQNVLRANVDRQSGLIDTWPAHSSNQRPVNMQLTLTKHNHLVVSNAVLEGKPDLTPKPKFLENLEKFLERELKALRCETASSAAPSESRLQAHREVFEYLIEEFKTYKPLLSAIKNEYELMLAHQRERIRELEPLKQMLVTLADQCDQKLMKFRDEERVQVKELKEEKKQLIELIGQLKNDRLALQTQVDRLHDELAVEHEHFRNESDKRKLLMVELNDIRFQQEEARKAEMQREKKRAAEGMAEEDNHDDPVTLKIALKMCRQNLTDAMKRLTRMEADYNDVIPRRDYQALETVYKEIEARNEALEKDNKTLKNEYNSLKDHHKQLENKFQEVMNELENSRQTNTPRPEWEMCTALIDGGAERMRELLHEKSSVELLEIVLGELTGFSKEDAPPEYFNGKGTDREVAPHLRYAGGRLRNHNFTRREVCVIINNIWKERHEYINSLPDVSEQMSLSEYIIGYFKSKHPTEEAAFEFSYSLNEALDKYPRNELIQLFSAALNFEVDEEMYHHERRVFKKLLDLLRAEAAVETGRDPDNETLSKEAFRDALKAYFKHKSVDQLDDLVKAAEEELLGDSSQRVEYLVLFKEDPEGKYGPFLSKLRAQMKEERSIFLNVIRDTIGPKQTLSPQELKRILHSLDESIPERDLDSVLNWVFDEAKPVGIDEFNAKVERCCLHEHQFNLADYLATRR